MEKQLFSILDRWGQFSGYTYCRVIDPSDNIALISLLFSYFLFTKFKYREINPILKYTIMGVSIFSFIATTQPRSHAYFRMPTYKFVNIESSYNFPFSKEELIERYNRFQIDRVNYHKKYYAGTVVFDSIENTYTSHYRDLTTTIAKILNYEELKDIDTIRIDDENAKFYITGNNQSSKINLTTITERGYISDTIIINKPTDSIVPLYNTTIKIFENRIIEKLNSY